MKLPTFVLTSLVLSLATASPITLSNPNDNADPAALHAAAVDDAAAKLDALSVKVTSLSTSISSFPPLPSFPPSNRYLNNA